MYMMVKFDLKIHKKQRTMYVPKELHETLGTNVKAVPNMRGVFMFPENLSTLDAIRSLKAIQEDLEHSVDLEEKEKENEKTE